MNKKTLLLYLFLILLTLSKSYANNTINPVSLSFFAPLPKVMQGSETDTTQQINLGKKLYFEAALSVNQTQSCNSCHNLINNASGVDNLIVPIGALGKFGTRNSPSTWNAGMQVAQFWDGRAKTLEQQVKFPLFNPKEMAMPSEKEVSSRLSNKGYLTEFKQAFPLETTPINIKNISKTLAAFQRTLITKDRFDEYLLGDKKAITTEEKSGLTTFIEKGCVACHNGPLLGGQLFMKMGIVHPYPNKIDKGVGAITDKAGDNYFFKVPSLRNILNTAPYFHDGAATTVEQAIEDTGWHQLGIKLNKDEINEIKTFFNTLNNKATVIE
ncbi:cytochrome-c peroxidase [Pseudocolwellia agarivorans]|uniref:cytochrome-c peroxidase n=1 Tax=Pseudocolwellia agarivorans TaxID=1911682 RepID=UPI000987293D|nr:cytochrome c peroxidase [Pseudocolwellia agarivorans]